MSRYEWKQRIAGGGMGEVWRAEDTVLGREVAVKVLKPELADDPKFRERFANEARNAASLHHPHIATVFDFGESAGDPPRPYLVMELVRGRPLSDLLQPGRPMPPERARDLVGQTADALAAAHRAGIVHRDVKPGNILVTPDGQVKVTDFGIARAADAVALTGTGEVLGTPHYLAPEQAEGRQATPASDVYALGVVLFELLAGRRPFSADTAVATALAHVREPVPELSPDVPADLAAITRRALSKDPSQRFTDGDAFAKALADPSSVPPPVPAPYVAPVPASDATTVLGPVAEEPATRVAAFPVPVPAAYDDEDDDRDDKGPRPLWPWLAVPAVALVALVLYLVFRGGGAEDTPADEPSDPVSSSSQAATQQINADDYVGLEVSEARDKLRGLGFDQFVTRTQTNPGDEDAGTVAAISPSGNVREGATITLTVWGDEPEPTPSDTPSASDTPTPTPSDTPSASPPTASPAAGPGKGNGPGNGPGKGNDKTKTKGPGGQGRQQ